MDHAIDGAVLGDFAGAEFTHNGVTSRFYRRDGGFYAYTDGPDGKMAEYEIKYTFGVYPLQQYLVELPGGRLQCLPICWESRPADDGGQRWFHVYGGETIAPNDILHWTRTSQNWNSMCAECHSTGLRKNYDPARHGYQTTWSDIDVACEACHGSGARHVEWAASDAGRETPSRGDRGFALKMETTRDRLWVIDAMTGTATLANPPVDKTQIAMCGACHAHRTAMAGASETALRFDDAYRLSLLDEQLYYPDGQSKAEVYVYGSFLQSKMYRAGVLCTDCHDPHSTGLVAVGDRLCLRCHLEEKYDNSGHHRHSRANNVNCVDCHMPVQTYMVVDQRREHSFSIPRPDLSAALGTPDACTHCHDNNGVEWTAGAFRQWYPERSAQRHWGETIHAARLDDPAALPLLAELVANDNLPPIVRATAAGLAGRYPKASEVLRGAVADTDPMVRRSAAEVVTETELDPLDLCAPLLDDPIRSVREAAVHTIASEFDRSVHSDLTAAFDRALSEHIESLELNGDVPSALLRRADLYHRLGELEKASEVLRDAIALEPAFTPAYVNLADLYRTAGMDDRGREVLIEGLSQSPKDAALHHALGLLLVRQGADGEALEHLGRASELAPGNARYAYVYAVALESSGHTREAISVYESAIGRHPYDSELLRGVIAASRTAGDFKRSERHARALERLLSPGAARK